MLDKREATRIAKLAALALNDEQLQAMADDMACFCAMCRALESADGLPDAPCVMNEGGLSALREDAPQPSLDGAELLRGAPQAENGQFAVPGVLP